jgi:hypothetical protein
MIIRVQTLRKAIALLAGVACVTLAVLSIFNAVSGHDLPSWGVFSAGIGLLALVDPVEIKRGQHGG